MRKTRIAEVAGDVKIGGRNINDLRYTDDTIISVETDDRLQCVFGKIKEKSAAAGLKLNMKKTFIITYCPIRNCCIDNEQVKVVREFIFLGSNINTDGNCSNKIKRRLLMHGKNNILLEQSHEK